MKAAKRDWVQDLEGQLKCCMETSVIHDTRTYLRSLFIYVLLAGCFQLVKEGSGLPVWSKLECNQISKWESHGMTVGSAVRITEVCAFQVLKKLKRIAKTPGRVRGWWWTLIPCYSPSHFTEHLHCHYDS